MGSPEFSEWSSVWGVTVLVVLALTSLLVVVPLVGITFCVVVPVKVTCDSSDTGAEAGSITAGLNGAAFDVLISGSFGLTEDNGSIWEGAWVAGACSGLVINECAEAAEVGDTPLSGACSADCEASDDMGSGMRGVSLSATGVDSGTDWACFGGTSDSGTDETCF